MKKHYWVNILFVLFTSCISTTSNSEITKEYFNVGNAFYELEEFDKAESYYLKVLDVDKEFHKARYNLVRVLVSKKDFSSAETHLNYLRKIDDNNILTNELDAYVKYKIGDLKGALQLYIGLFEDGDISKENLSNIVKLSYQIEDYETANKFLNDLLLKSDDKDLYYIAGLVSEGVKELEKAAEYFKLYIDSKGENLDVYEKLSSIYRFLGDYENLKVISEAILEKKIVELVPLAQFELGQIALINNNDFSLGYGYLEDAIDSGFKDVSAISGLLDEPDLIEKDKIRLLFVENKIIE